MMIMDADVLLLLWLGLVELLVVRERFSAVKFGGDDERWNQIWTFSF
jgi:hypothetical protein